MTQRSNGKTYAVCISTHTLTWSVTVQIRQFLGQQTFQLTRSRGAWPIKILWQQGHIWFQLTRSRGAWLPAFLRSRTICWFQLTRSRGAWPAASCTVSNRSSFQLTRSRGAWRFKGFQHCNIIVISTHTLTWSVTEVRYFFIWGTFISTHTLTWSVTCSFLSLCNKNEFQLTRSRGAWPMLLRYVAYHINFNSHAHVERDCVAYRI